MSKHMLFRVIVGFTVFLFVGCSPQQRQSTPYDDLPLEAAQVQMRYDYGWKLRVDAACAPERTQQSQEAKEHCAQATKVVFDEYLKQSREAWDRVAERQEWQRIQRQQQRALERSDHGQTVYSEDECIGPVIMGQCHGTILDKGGHHPKCYGTMLNGQCTGPMF